VGGGGEDMFGIDDEEDLELIAIDAEVIRGMIRTQGEIIVRLDMLYSKMDEMINAYNDSRVWIKKLCETNKGLSDNAKLLNDTNFHMAESYRGFIDTAEKLVTIVKKLEDKLKEK